jgi:serine/threonine-protein kinase
MSGHVVGGRYRLQQQLGRGGMASVWRARDTRLDRSAAVKLLDPVWRADPVALERLRREAHSVARLAHQNIVGVYDFDVADDGAYLVMELVEGRSVSQLLGQQGPVPVEQAVSIAAQTCDALGAAHAAGIVHRDIKPSNILVSPAGVVKVCDFGLARLQRTAGEAALTRTGTVVGTCQYMAPEQATGEWVDGRSDLYAMGCVLYMMLVGAPPFNGATPIDVLDMHLHEPPVPLRAHRTDIPPDLQELVAELLAKDRADRPATAWAVRDRLMAIAGQPVATSNPPAAAPRAGEDWPTQPTLVSPTPAGMPGAATSDDPGATGRHRAAWVAAPAGWWHRLGVSRSVAVLVAVAVVTAVLAAVVLAVGGGPGTPVGASPSLSLTASPDAGAPFDEPTLSPEPSGPTPSPSSSRTVAATAPPARATPVDLVAMVAAILQQQADAGRLQPKAARELLRDLNEVARLLSRGETGEAARKFDEFRKRVTELRKNGKFTDAGFDALPNLGRIAQSLNAG